MTRGPAPSPNTGRGNLLVIMSDEHQARAMSCAGHPLVKTPNLDALAARGTRFTNAYTPSPICVPARAAFATGRPVHQTRHWDNAMPYHGTPDGWGHALQAGGIAVESIGKLHYRNAEDPAGFDRSHIPMHVAGGVGMVWGSIRAEAERAAPSHRMLGDHIGAGTSPYTDYDAAVTAHTRTWLANAPKHPWCLFTGLVAPHFPLVAPQAFYDLYPLDALPDWKQHPRDGQPRHPWVETQNALMDSDSAFADETERKQALAAYFALCSWMDHNLGQILAALDEHGLRDTTSIIYTSDHGENAGARGLWGKSVLYQESTQIPLIAAGPAFAPGATCKTPVSLLDVSASIPAHFGLPFCTADGTRPIQDIAAEPVAPNRPVFSEYHAVGSTSAAYMLRIGRWKYHHYVGHDPELFDLVNDPEELTNLAPFNPTKRLEMETALRKILDPEVTNDRAFADQAALIARHGGPDAARKLGAPGASPPPKT